MKIDFEMLEKLEAAGTPAKAIIAMLRTQFEREESKKKTKRPKDAERIRGRRAATKGGHAATPSDIERHKATLDDSPRARLFRECVPALVSLNIKESRARALIAGWLKATHDDDQRVTAAILRARDLAVADAPGWILATLNQGKRNGQGTSAVGSAFDDLIARSEGRGSQDRGEPTDVTDARAEGR